MPRTAAIRAARSICVVLGLLLGSVVLVGATPVAQAGPPPDTAWFGSGPTGVVQSDGTTSNPRFSYDLRPAGIETSRNWTFETTAAKDATINVPWDYRGDHEFFQVTVFLYAVVIRDGEQSSRTLVNDGPANCCRPPSGGRFVYSGRTDFDVQAGDIYGFEFGGSNTDDNNRLAGTLTVPYNPYDQGPQADENTSWPTAKLLTSGTATGTLTADGQARWYKFPVQPSSRVQVDLTHLARNYDLTLYDDIGAAFTSLTSTDDLNTIDTEQTGNAYAPSIYSPSIYSPSIYSPSIYSPSIYSPSIYSPSIYSPSIYSPSIYSPSIYSPSIYSPSIYSPSIYSPSIYSPSQAFLDAFSGAQTRSLIGISARDATADETVSAAVGNNTGYYYVRVAGRNGVSSATPFHLRLTSAGGPCTGITLHTYASAQTLSGHPGGARTVLVTDSSRLDLRQASLRGRLTALAKATGGVVVDVARSERVADLQRQADAHPTCAYAENLVAQAIREIVLSYRDAVGTLKYVALIGGDSVVPYFRYPDTAGIGPENGYVPPVLGSSISQASLRGNDVLGQDAYGSALDLSLNSAQFPVPELAVGRLVETPAEISGQIAEFLRLPGHSLPTPHSSLVTGYDFLTSAADSVQSTFRAGLEPGARTDALVTDQGVPTTRTTGPSGPSRDASWTATDLANALFGSHHDLVFIAGHFSANSTLAADYRTSLITPDIEAHPGQFTDSLVFSAGCHSGYNLLDEDGVPGLTLGLDWAQAMARQKAILIAGTGYQYADTDFLAYSAKLYADFAQQLRRGPTGSAITIGQALVSAKRQYLAASATLTGIDQKTLIEATMYGLPMTRIDLPRRAPVPVPPARTSPSRVDAGTPGRTLRLSAADVGLDTPTTEHSKDALSLSGSPTGSRFHWLSGPAGTLTQPALPALPEQLTDATASDLSALRGVGFRSGTYTDTSGVLPLTGAPTTEQNGVHTTFASPAFYPQNLVTVNRFGALGAADDPNTSLIITPAQYRSDSPTSTTATERRYSHVGLRLFYSHNVSRYGRNRPALAASPSISQVSSTVSTDLQSVTVKAHVTGDPSAGIQQVWVTYTGEAGPLHGAWASIDLTQDYSDSTLWEATIALPAGQSPNDVRFLLQAVNGVGLVTMDNDLGRYYTPGVDLTAIGKHAKKTSIALDTVASSAAYGSDLRVGATLTGAHTGSVVTFALGDGQVAARTDSAGHATAKLPLRLLPGVADLVAAYDGDATHRPSAAAPVTVRVTKAPTTLSVVVTRSGTTRGSTRSTRRVVTVHLASRGAPLTQRPILFTVQRGNHVVARAAQITDGSGRASFTPGSLPSGVLQVDAVFGADSAGSVTDPAYASVLAGRTIGHRVPVTPPTSSPPTSSPPSSSPPSTPPASSSSPPPPSTGPVASTGVPVEPLVRRGLLLLDAGALLLLCAAVPWGNRRRRVRAGRHRS